MNEKNNYLKYDLQLGNTHIHICENKPNSSNFSVKVTEKYDDCTKELILPSTSPFCFDGELCILTPLTGENSIMKLSRFKKYFGAEEL